MSNDESPAITGEAPSAITLQDFWPPTPPRLEDFYPEGKILFPVVSSEWAALPTSFAPFAIDLSKRLVAGIDAQIELFTTMKFLITLCAKVTPEVAAQIGIKTG